MPISTHARPVEEPLGQRRDPAPVQVDHRRELVGRREDVLRQVVDARPFAGQGRFPPHGPAASASRRGAPTAMMAAPWRRTRTRRHSFATSNASRRSRSTVKGAPAWRRPATYAARKRSRARSIQASMSRPGRSIGPGPLLGPAARAARDVVERAEQRRDVAQRRVGPSAVLDRAQRLALEVDDAVAVVRDEDLAEVQVGVDAHHGGRRRHGLEPRDAGRDRRRLALRARAAMSRSTAATAGIARLSCRSASWRHARSSSWDRVARGEVRRVGRGRGERRVEAGRQRAEVRGDLGRPVQARGPGRRDEPGEELGDALVRVVGVGDERLEHRDRRRAAVAGHDLGPAREARHARRSPPPRSGTRSARGPG